jgi:hypothetical protein
VRCADQTCGAVVACILCGKEPTEAPPPVHKGCGGSLYPDEWRCDKCYEWTNDTSDEPDPPTKAKP